MANKARKKHVTNVNVYDAAIERIHYLYKRFDNVVVSFSGGKDSTAVLNLTIEVARELGKLPVKAIFVDEEAIHPTTVEYVERVRNHPDIDLDWYCLPVKHRNACSNEQPFWYCWNPEERELWVRELPECGITTHCDFTLGDSFQDWMPRIFPNSMGTVAVLTGIRTQESLRRYRVIASKKNDAFINAKAEYKNTYRAHPIYDWSSEDVWKLVEVKELDYNRTYDIFNHTELWGKLLTQRVCPPFGEEPLRGLWVYAECWPELWHKMLHRVKGVATAWRYANTELYSNWKKPENLSWKQYAEMVIESYTEPEYRDLIRQNINAMVRLHFSKTDDPILEDVAHPISGCSWKFMAKIAIKGDFKGRQSGAMTQEANAVLVKLGLTLEEAKVKYGKKKRYVYGKSAGRESGLGRA
jgi:predicted phosphoadenosine phosphosulfate sulfurtransferase